MTTPTALSVKVSLIMATTLGDYALFGGGRTGINPSTYFIIATNIIDAYDTALIKSNTVALSIARENGAATTLGDYALFSGGMIGEQPLYSAVTDVYQC